MNEGWTFGEAIQALKQGSRVARVGWNGKGMYLLFHEAKALPGGKTLLAHLLMSTVQGDLVPWLASQTDVLAEDWSLIE